MKCLSLFISATMYAYVVAATTLPSLYTNLAVIRPKAVVITERRPMTLNEKVDGADLIVLGRATTIGERLPSRYNDYERLVQIDCDEVFWPLSTELVDRIIVRYGVREIWPQGYWNYDNKPGVFFLKERRPSPDLSAYDDVGVTVFTASNTIPVTLSLAAKISQSEAFVRLGGGGAEWIEESGLSNDVKQAVEAREKKEKNKGQASKIKTE